MDILKRELIKKRRLLAEETGGRKLFRRHEIDQRIQEREKLAFEANTAQKPNTAFMAAVGGTNLSTVSGDAAASEDARSNGNIDLPRQEVIRRLRFLKQPITQFGEDDAARIDRLEYVLKAGLFEVDGDLTEGQTNDFIRDIIELSNRQRIGIPVQFKKRKNRTEVEKIGDDDVENRELDDLCDEDKIRIFFRRLLNEWNQELDEMPEAEKRSREGKETVARFKQTVRESNPLFESCRKKALPDDIRRALLLVVESCGKRDYQAAMRHYVNRLAIGNAPWPIGVTMVGIHERSARENIFTSSVAHIMNDETKRKYLQSVKRLMSFCQRRYPTTPSKSA